MQAATLVPLSEYLTTVYEPDVDYVDGVLEDRNVGEKDHSWLQGLLLVPLFGRRKQFGIHVYPELRLKISETRYRVPDLCVFAEEPKEQIPSQPPFLAIEILSPEDRVTRVQRKVKDHLSMGVGFVWVIDPQSRSGWVYTKDGAIEAAEGVFTAGPVSVRLTDLN